MPELYREWTTCPDVAGTGGWSAEDYRRWNAAYPKLQALVRMEVAAHQPDACPLCARGLPVVKPGSRA